MKETIEPEQDPAHILHLLAQAAPPQGMETRIVAQVRQRRAEMSASPAPVLGRPWLYALASVAVAAVALMVSLHRASPTPAVVAHPSPVLPFRQAKTTAPQFLSVHATATRRRPRARQPHSGHSLQPVAAQSSPAFQNPPALPLSSQERLLLEVARSHARLSAPAPDITSEVVANHGIGRNSIFELGHQELAPLKSTLQTSPIQGDLE